MALMKGRAAAGGLALINSIGNLGGFVGPSLVGYVRETTGSVSAGLIAISCALFIAAGTAIALRRGLTS
jgi:ACS family tartrate transporter-like MFS transporter